MKLKALLTAILLGLALSLGHAFADDDSARLLEFFNARMHQVQQDYPASVASQFFAYFYDASGAPLGPEDFKKMAQVELTARQVDLIYRFFYLRLAGQVEGNNADELRVQYFESDFFGKSMGDGMVHFLETLHGHDRFMKSRGNHSPEELEKNLKRMDPLLLALPLVAIPDLIAGIASHAPLYNLFDKERAEKMVLKIDQYAAAQSFAWRFSRDFRKTVKSRSKFLKLAEMPALQRTLSCSGFLLGNYTKPPLH